MGELGIYNDTVSSSCSAMPSVQAHMENQGANANATLCTLVQGIHSVEEFVKKACFQGKRESVGQQDMEVLSSNSVSYKEEEEKSVKGGVDPCCGFQMPLHYPRYSKVDYEEMAEWKLDNLFREYGVPIRGNVQQKRSYAMGAFLWPHQI